MRVSKLLHWECLCSRLTSCMWTSRRIDSLINRAMRIDKSLHWWCHCSRLISCMWMSRRINSLMSRMMKVSKSLHWERCHCSRLTVSLLIKIETSRSFKLISLIALWNRDFMQFYNWSRLFIKFKEFLANLNERLIRWSLI